VLAGWCGCRLCPQVVRRNNYRAESVPGGALRLFRAPHCGTFPRRRQVRVQDGMAIASRAKQARVLAEELHWGMVQLLSCAAGP